MQGKLETLRDFVLYPAEFTNLLRQGYEWVGYHGCNERAALSICRDVSELDGGFDQARIGSGAGLARGRGVYVSLGPTIAADFAENAIHHDYEPDNPLNRGSAGIFILLVIFARNFSQMVPGIDYDWGPMGRNEIGGNGGIYNQPRPDHEFEIVFRARSLAKLAALPLCQFCVSNATDAGAKLPVADRPRTVIRNDFF